MPFGRVAAVVYLSLVCSGAHAFSTPSSSRGLITQNPDQPTHFLDTTPASAAESSHTIPYVLSWETPPQRVAIPPRKRSFFQKMIQRIITYVISTPDNDLPYATPFSREHA